MYNMNDEKSIKKTVGTVVIYICPLLAISLFSKPLGAEIKTSQSGGEESRERATRSAMVQGKCQVTWVESKNEETERYTVRDDLDEQMRHADTSQAVDHGE